MPPSPTSAGKPDFDWIHWLPSPAQIITKEGEILAMNRQFAEMLGYEKPEDLVGNNNFKLTKKEDRTADIRDTQAIIKAGLGTYHKTKRYLAKSGDTVYAQVKGRPVQGVIVVEVASFRRGNQSGTGPAAGYDLLNRIMNRAPFLIYTRDLNGRFTLINRCAEEAWGITRREIEGKTPHDLFEKDRATKMLDHDAEVAQSGKPHEFEDHMIAHGREFVSLTWAFPLYDEKGFLTGVGGMAADITPRIKAERKLRKLSRKYEDAYKELKLIQLQLIQAEKMESIGRLAAGVAHEVKNPLAMMLMGIEYMSNLPKEVDPNLEEVLEQMRTAVKRAEAIVHGMVDFSANRQLEFHHVTMNFIVESCLPFLRHELTRDHIDLELDLAPDLPEMRVDVQKFEQVVVNLALNAIQAMGRSGGTLTISTSTEQLVGLPYDAGIRTRDHLRTGDTVTTITIKDTGPGISSENLQRIFDPFFTTKPTGEGTGLGLSICRKIIDLHNGWIDVFSKVGAGTAIRIMMKVSSNESADHENNPTD
ncbi:PAS domain S-box protein [Sulfuriroseicoccus oceanibius]|uniref:histidine kinase n=1 Tax=Sulfuriroseicoccus oceanibius TaxID=2707525 RepID=A0A7T7F2C4_9BACT|nr:PAS domain S-box protein [Sulfuriroseicoccus oceanibius]QQL45527.1 PAS domain S-box protein [Sulfuriroseicoccus oceanibius]